MVHVKLSNNLEKIEGVVFKAFIYLLGNNENIFKASSSKIYSSYSSIFILYINNSSINHSINQINIYIIILFDLYMADHLFYGE